jgi:hypothetical protein
MVCDLSSLLIEQVWDAISRQEKRGALAQDQLGRYSPRSRKYCALCSGPAKWMREGTAPVPRTPKHYRYNDRRKDARPTAEAPMAEKADVQIGKFDIRATYAYPGGQGRRGHIIQGVRPSGGRVDLGVRPPRSPTESGRARQRHPARHVVALSLTRSIALR